MRKRLSIFFLALPLFFLAVADCRAGSLDEFRRAVTAGAHYSLSGQFVIHDPSALDNYPVPLGNAPNIVRIDPTLLTVSCERIKKTLLNKLGVRDQWKGKIFLDLHHAQSLDEPIAVTPALFDGQWMYRLEMPDTLDRSRMISAVVEVLLLEMADRDALRSTEIPAWLSQGMSREVILSSDSELILERPRSSENGVALSRMMRTNLMDNPLEQAHNELMTMAPLSLAELSWPRPDQFNGEAADAYRSSAQLFVHELLLLNDGRACMQSFLPELPRHLNWQLAFLRAFRSDFGSQLDLEKWWALRLVQFTGRDLAQTWRPEDSWQKLDEVVRPSVEIRTSADEMPLRSQVTLQAIIRDWDIPRQTRLLQEKSQQLLMLRLRVSQDLIYLVDDYRRTLDGYLRKRDSNGYNQTGRTLYAPRLDNVARDTLRALDVLEARRQQLRPKPDNSPSIAATAPASH
ncbi:MAG: hypothetical protein JWQ04_1832 [Pedosphaera sp.]|nr:hypothetical protein [Pedosphaera sp.]